MNTIGAGGRAGWREPSARGLVSNTDPAPGAAENLLVEAQAVEHEQQAMLEGSTLEQTYQTTLAAYVQAKDAQLYQIEDRLEHLIEQQEARLQQTQALAPGLLSLPSSRRAWQGQVAQQQARLQTLHTRLDAVREIKDGMGLHAPRVEELATRKMRADNPELTESWDAMQQAGRLHQEHMKQERKAHEKAQERARAGGQARTLGAPAGA